ncbi:uncharacterized protein K489DRAFT_412576 [Dissoconium aciculare CBS 342.82]|uniref:Uncharacterized protein n=1 Tax=Dissoconium aciculare CBS 342.82 TaxID=1314786 RepID=A0A6J3LW45_9PEZI|nr:uncharacterized protein K489DRAFT_412576 [Dissoconium aciculare CBS 342.82]KAF1819893.1 hypothetical protein K489DRAFT_412576 [Dissoconium aciculare CBS 342.82]
MDKLKGVAKGGWHPSGDKAIHRDTWKSDLKGIASGKKHDPYESARNHQSTPLTSLKDPDSFGPPPKHIPNSHDDTNSQALSTVRRPAAASGSGARVPTAASRQIEQSVEVAKPVVPYRTDTTGLRTDNLPKPPSRSAIGGVPSPKTASPVPLPARQTTGIIPRGGPPPVLPPRENSATTQHGPTPPPAYNALNSNRNVPLVSVNPQAASNLARAGISVPALGIDTASTGAASRPAAGTSQVNELQQRFARMNASASASPISPTAAGMVAAAAQKKAAPPPPPKKAILQSHDESPIPSAGAPPPIPLSSKPRP